MGKYRFPLVNLIFWLAIVFTCYLVENIGLLTEQIFRGFDPVTFVIVFSGAVILYFVYFFLEHKKNKMKVDFVLLPLLTVLFFVMAWNIWRQPETSTFTNISTGYKAVVSFTKFERVEYTLELFISLVGTYATLFCFSRSKTRSRKLIWFPMVIIGYSAISCIGSFFTDFEIYKNIFVNGNFETGIMFYYYSENLFGYALLLGLLCCFIVNYHKKRWWTYVCIIWFMAEIVLTSSATSMIVGLISTLLYFFLEIFLSFKKHPIRSAIFLASYISVGIGLLCTYFALKNNENSFIAKISSTFEEYLLNKDYSTFTGRTILWHDALDLIGGNKLNLWFGRGYRTSTELFRGYTAAMNNGDYVSSAHSAIFEILMRNGIGGLVLYAIGIIYFFYCCIHLLIKKKVRFVLIYMLCILSLMVQGIVEADTFFTMNVTGTVETMIFIMPVIIAHKCQLHPCLVEEAKTYDVWPSEINYHHLSHTISSCIMALIIGCLSTLLVSKMYSNKLILTIVLYILLLLVICLLFVPYSVSLLYRHSTTKKFVFRCVIYGIILIVPSSLLFVLGLINNSLMTFALIAIPIVMIITLSIITTLHSIGKGGSFKEYIKDTIVGAFVFPLYGLIASIVIGFIAIVILNASLPLNYHSMVCLSVINMLLYLACFLFIPKKETKEIINYFNNAGMVTIRRLALKDEV